MANRTVYVRVCIEAHKKYIFVQNAPLSEVRSHVIRWNMVDMVDMVEFENVQLSEQGFACALSRIFVVKKQIATNMKREFMAKTQ